MVDWDDYKMISTLGRFEGSFSQHFNTLGTKKGGKFCGSLGLLLDRMASQTSKILEYSPKGTSFVNVSYKKIPNMLASDLNEYSFFSNVAVCRR